jgi:hypothetical protein
MNIDSPFHIDDSQRTATATLDDHMIEQLVFTRPGERVNPSHCRGGSSTTRLAANSVELRLGVAVAGPGALQLYLADLIDVTAAALVDAVDRSPKVSAHSRPDRPVVQWP